MTIVGEPLPSIAEAEAEVVTLTQELIRIDSSNWGDSAETVGEAEIADYCAARLREVGLDPEVIVTPGIYVKRIVRIERIRKAA